MKIIYEKNGIAAIITPTPEFLNSLKGTLQQKMEIVASKNVPDGSTYSVIKDSDLPTDRVFRNGWVYDPTKTKKCREDLTKCRELAHAKRRIKRDEQFKPLDIKATIPAEQVQAEIDRQVIRDADAALQIDMDGAKTVKVLKALLP